MRTIVFIIVLLFGLGCTPDALQDPLPPSFVNTYIVLNTQETQQLNFDNSYIYIDEGLRGVVIYHKENMQFFAFDRNCPYEFANDSAIVDVHSSMLYMECRHCQSRFDFSGRVLSGPAQFPLRPYQTQLQGNLLYVSGSY